MSVKEWYVEKEDAQRAYDADRISRETYELRTRFAIGMIHRCGKKSDKEAAKRMADAHGYDIKELIDFANGK